MKIGIGTYALDWSIGVPGSEPEHPMDAFQVVEFAKDVRAEVIQFGDNLPLHMLEEIHFERLLSVTKSYGIDLEVGIRGIQPENLKKYIRIARRCGSNILRAVIDAEDFHPEIPEIIDIIRDAAGHLRENGVVLALENHDRFKAAQFAEIIEAVGTDVSGICLDTVNSFGALEGPDVVIGTLIDYVVNLHVKDFRIYRPPHNMGFLIEGTPAGEGMLDIPSLVHMLKKRRTCSNVILELWPTPEKIPEDTAEKEKRWVRRSMEYLLGLQF